MNAAFSLLGKKPPKKQQSQYIKSSHFASDSGRNGMASSKSCTKTRTFVRPQFTKGVLKHSMLRRDSSSLTLCCERRSPSRGMYVFWSLLRPFLGYRRSPLRRRAEGSCCRHTLRRIFFELGDYKIGRTGTPWGWLWQIDTPLQGPLLSAGASPCHP